MKRINRRYRCDVCKRFAAAFLTDRTRVLGIRENGIFVCMECLLIEVGLFNDGQIIKAIIEGKATEGRDWCEAEGVKPHGNCRSDSG